MTRSRAGLLPAVALLACRSAPEAPPTPPPPPPLRHDVVLVTLDTTRSDHIGAYGHARAATPTLDALAARGRRFERAYSPLPLTIPSHTSIFTGLYPPRHGIRSNGDRSVSPELVTLAEVLRDHGWSTGAAVAAFVTSRVWGFDQGFDAYLDQGIVDGGNFWHGERPATAVVDDALRWVESQPGTEPKFLWVHLFDAHLPYRAPEPFATDHAGRPYDAELAYVDQELGRLFAAFDPSKTLFVVVGDHGEGLGDHGEPTHGLYVYDATQRVPFLMAGPGVPTEVVSTPVSLVDVAPTILATLQLPPLADIDGRAWPAEPRPIYLETWQLAQRFGLAPHRAVVSGAHKLVALPRAELYDVVADPAEANDLAAADPAKVAELRAAFDAFGFGAPEAPEALDPSVGQALEALGYLQGDGPTPVTADLPDPKDHQALVSATSRARALLAAGDTAGAVALNTELITAYPDVVELRMRQITLLHRLGRHADARAVLESALEGFPDHEPLLISKAQSLVVAGDLRGASALYVRVAEAMPYVPDLRARAVYSLAMAPDARDEALELGLRFLADHPDDAAVAGLVAIELFNRGRASEARPHLEVASTLPRPPRHVLVHLGVMMTLEGRLDDARVLLEREVALWPDNTAGLKALQVVLGQQRDWAALVAVADRIVLADPSVYDAWLAKAQALFNLEDFSEARAAWTRAAALRPGRSELLLLDANLLAKEGRRSDAEARFAEAVVAREREQAATASP